MPETSRLGAQTEREKGEPGGDAHTTSRLCRRRLVGWGLKCRFLWLAKTHFGGGEFAELRALLVNKMAVPCFSWFWGLVLFCFVLFWSSRVESLWL